MNEDWFYLINYIVWAVILIGLGFYAYKACHPERRALTGVIMFLVIFFITSILGIFIGMIFLPKKAIALPLFGAFFIARYAIKRPPA